MAQVLHKAGGLVDGATAGRGLGLVHGQENEIVIVHPSRGLEVLAVSRPGANKFLQGWQDVGGIQRAGRCEKPKTGRGRQLVKGNPHVGLNEGWLGLAGQGNGWI